jgi:hypothetical protein
MSVIINAHSYPDTVFMKLLASLRANYLSQFCMHIRKSIECIAFPYKSISQPSFALPSVLWYYHVCVRVKSVPNNSFGTN